MNRVKLVAVFAENKPGQTARLTGVLAAAGVNVRWVTIASTGPFGVMKFLVDQPETAFAALKQHGVAVSFLDVLAVEVPDRPGALHAVADCLAQDKINLDNASGFVANQRAILVVEAHELARAEAVLQQAGLRVLTQAEMLGL
ncbi:MAG: ACT domain-containing protein [Verrucomicrobiota bacterium]|jgi:hypothetical protein